MSQCCETSCLNFGLKLCSGCLKEGYCSSGCQKKDWKKIHKFMCGYMKNDKFLSFTEVEKKLIELAKQASLKDGTDCIRILKCAVSFAEFQFNERLVGKTYRERDGVRVGNHHVEMGRLIPLCTHIGLNCQTMGEHMTNFNLRKEVFSEAIHYFEKALGFLEPWLSQVNLQECERIESINQENVGLIFIALSTTTNGLSGSYSLRRDYKKAEDYCEDAIAYAERSGDLTLLYNAFVTKGNNLMMQERNSEAKSVFEESYNLVVTAHDPVHPLVLQAGDLLINSCLLNKEYYDAERFSRFCYQSLTRPIDSESEEVASVARSLAEATYHLIVSKGVEGGDLLEAEMLSRKSLRICEKFYGRNHFTAVSILSTLSNILRLKGGHDDEVKSLLEQCRTITISDRR